jgi:outer membrane protein TolC
MRSIVAVAAVAVLTSVLCVGCDSPEQQQAMGEFKGCQGYTAQCATQPVADAELPRLTDKSTLADYLAFAALNNPGLRAAFERWKAALEMIPQARSLPDPQFTFRYFAVPQEMRDGDMRFAYELGQTLPWFGKLELKGDMAAQDAQAALKRFEGERLALFSRVAEAYYEYYYVVRAGEIARDNVGLLKSIEQVALGRYRAGPGSQPDVIRAQVELGKMENEASSLGDMLTSAAAKLNAAMNRPSDAPLPKGIVAAAPAPAFSDQMLVAWMVQSNPELAAMEFDIARERKGVELAGKDFYPDFMIGAEFDQMTKASDVSGSPMDPVAIMLSVNIPIWRDKYAAEVRQAKTRQSAALCEKKEKLNSLTADLKMESFNFRNAQRKVSLYRDTLLPKAQQALKSTQASYQTGTAGFSDLIDTQRELLEFELNYERALADSRQAIARLEAIVGRPISEAASNATAATTRPAPATRPAPMTAPGRQ